MKSTGTCCSSNHCSTPICASPSAPPPSRATPIFSRCFVKRGASPCGAVGSCATAKIGNTSSRRKEKARPIEFLRENPNSSVLEGKFVAGSYFHEAIGLDEFHNQNEFHTHADLFSCRMFPPSTTKDCPVMYEAAGEAKKHIAAATSSGVPARPIGVCRPAMRSTSVDDAVSIHPGATPL